MSRSKVAVLKVKPDTVLQDIDRLFDRAEREWLKQKNVPQP